MDAEGEPVNSITIIALAGEEDEDNLTGAVLRWKIAFAWGENQRVLMSGSEILRNDYLFLSVSSARTDLTVGRKEPSHYRAMKVKVRPSGNVLPPKRICPMFGRSKLSRRV